MPPEFLDKWIERFVRRVQSKVDPESCRHAWLVCGCVLSDVSLDTCCTKCGVYGSIKDPTLAEWEAARGSVRRPYPWPENARVTAGKRHF